MRHFAFSFLCRQSNSSIFYGFNSHFDNFERGYKERAKCNFKARNHLTAKSSRSYLFTSIQCKIQSFPYPSRKNPCKSFKKKTNSLFGQFITDSLCFHEFTLQFLLLFRKSLWNRSKEGKKRVHTLHFQRKVFSALIER